MTAFPFLRAGTAALALAAAVAPAAAQFVPTPTPTADALAAQVRQLATNPRDVYALIAAGELSTKLGDPAAALAFFGRAQAVEPTNPRIAAGKAGALVLLERPGEALQLYGQAERAGVSMTPYLAQRGLAYDLIGQPGYAQRDYRRALLTDRDDETVRRLALSLGIAGRPDDAMALLDPLLRRSDRAAWRARACILAMSGDVTGAQRIATSMMSGGAALSPFFGRLRWLSPADRAFAVHFGEVTASVARSNDARLAPVLAALPVEPQQAAAPATVAAADVRTPDRREARRRRSGRAPTVVATVAPVTAPALPEPPGPPRSLTVLAMRDPLPAAGMVGAPNQPRPYTPAPSVVRPIVQERTPSPAARSTPLAATPWAMSADAMRTPLPAPRSGDRPAPDVGTSPARRTANVAPIAVPVPTPAPTQTLPTPAPTSTPAPTPAPVATAPVQAIRPPVSQATTQTTAQTVPSPVMLASPTAAAGVPASAPVNVPSPVVQSVAPATSTADVAAPPATIAPSGVATPSPQPSPLPASPTAIAPVGAAIVPAPASNFSSAEGAPVERAVAAPPPPPPPPPLRPEARTPEVARRNTQMLASIIDTIAVPASELGVAPVESSAPRRVSEATRVAVGDSAKAMRSDRKPSDAKGAAADTSDAKTGDGTKPDTKKSETKKLDAKKPDTKKVDAKKPDPAKSDPARWWVQVAGGANAADLGKDWKRLSAKSPAAFRGKSAWTTPLRATNRLLAGPFASQGEAMAFVNLLAKDGASAFAWQSDTGQKIERLPTK